MPALSRNACGDKEFVKMYTFTQETLSRNTREKKKKHTHIQEKN